MHGKKKNPNKATRKIQKKRTEEQIYKKNRTLSNKQGRGEGEDTDATNPSLKVKCILHVFKNAYCMSLKMVPTKSKTFPSLFTGLFGISLSIINYEEHYY